MAALPGKAQTKEAYVVQSADKTTLTFKYDGLRRLARKVKTWGIDDKHEGSIFPAWAGNFNETNTQTKKVVFDESFKGYRPTRTNGWFYNCSGLQAIEGIGNLNTSQVTYMASMFTGCSSLTSIDVSGFNTGKVTDMRNMFWDCSSLTSLDVSGFDTRNVTNMEDMFRNCSSLNTIYCNEAWTVENSIYMFHGCTSLVGAANYDDTKTDAEMANPTTGYFTKKTVKYGIQVAGVEVTDANAANLAVIPGVKSGKVSYDPTTKTLTLDNAVIESDGVGIFAYLSESITIRLIGTNKVKGSTGFSRQTNSTTLTGVGTLEAISVGTGCGIFMDKAHLFIDSCTVIAKGYRGIAGKGDETWYHNLLVKNGATVKATGSQGGSISDMGGLVLDGVSYLSPAGAKFDAAKHAVVDADGNIVKTEVVIGRKPEAYVVQSTDNTTLTFYYDTKRATRTGDQVWDIDETHDGSDRNIPIWAGRGSSSSSDHNTWTTKAVFDESFADYRPTRTQYWFNNCTRLQTIEGIGNLNTSQVTHMDKMFYGCNKLTSIDVSNWDTHNVESMYAMFYGCTKLAEIDPSRWDTGKVTYMREMFTKCSSLVSIDLSGWNTGEVTSTADMFYGCYSLVSLKVSGWDMRKVESMDKMFKACFHLEPSLDLSDWKVGNDFSCSEMFYGCSALSTIYCNDTWTAGYSKDMFMGCEKLKGAVAYDGAKLDVSMANPTTGYFTGVNPTAIKGLTDDSGEVESIYTADGRKVSSMQHGINIVRMNGGRSIKVVK